MERRLADFCDSEWQRMLDAACLEAVVEANTIVSMPAGTVETITGLFRLPRAVIKQAIAFAQENAGACLRARQDVASLPVADPWDARRQAVLGEQIGRVLDRLALQVEHRWGLTSRVTKVLQYVAEGDLLRELAASWEEGQRAFHQALQAGGGGAPPSPIAVLKENRETPGNKKRRKRGGKTEDRLNDLMASDGGWQKIRACRTAKEVGKLVDRCHGSVVGTEAWKQKIYPDLRAQKDMAKYHRLEQEERRRDRHQTD
jgi:hypothetical protein